MYMYELNLEGGEEETTDHNAKPSFSNPQKYDYRALEPIVGSRMTSPSTSNNLKPFLYALRQCVRSVCRSQKKLRNTNTTYMMQQNV